MSVRVVTIAIFVGIFVLATLRNIHLGVAMFAAAVGIGLWLGGVSMDDIIGGFPISLFVLWVGVTYFSPSPRQMTLSI